MIFLLIGFIAFCLWLSVCFRLMISHPLLFVFYAIKDFYNWLRYKNWRMCKRADLICFTGLFGKGKTLSAVHQVLTMFRRYNNKRVFDAHRKKWVTQKVLVISNVQLKSIPFEYMKSLSQIVRFCDTQNKLDEENDTLTILFVLIDEASVQLNSRNFKDNIDPNFLNTLLTCRHYHICGIYCTSQRFKLEDKLLRDVTQKVVECKKIWRFQLTTYYDAWELENANNPLLLKPLLRTGWFVRNKDYAAYDTLACVEDLAKSCKDKDMLSEAEILQLRGSMDIDQDSVAHPSFRLKRQRRQK